MADCVMCSVVVPEGQTICSMCYGDIDYGSDGYYREYMRRWQEEHDRQQWERERQEEADA